MKKLSLLLIFCLCFLACSVDNEDFDKDVNQILEVNAETAALTCNKASYDLGSVGDVEISHDGSFLYVTISANSGNSLASTNLHIAATEGGFPTVGKGNLPPGQMDHQLNFSPNVEEYTFAFPLTQYNGCVYIASLSTVISPGSQASYWAGNILEKNGNWAYFQYCIQECPAPSPCDYFIGAAGPDKSGTILYSEADAIGSLWEVQNIFTDLIEVGISDNQLNDFNRFDPGIPAIVEEFNKLDDQDFGTYNLITTFTYSDGDCEDEVELTITVIDDRN